MKSFVSEALVLAAITTLLYLYAYFFEIGFAYQFRYPPDLIGPTLSSLAGSWIVLLFVFVFSFLQLNLQYWPHEKRWKAVFAVTLVAFVVATLTVMAMWPRWAVVIVSVSSATTAILANRVYAIAVRRLRAAATNKHSVHLSPDLKDIPTVYDSKSSIPTYSIAHALTKKLGQDPLIHYMVFLIVIPLVCAYAGATQGAGQRDFYLIQDKGLSIGEELIVRIVDRIIISAPFDSQTNTYRRIFRIRDASEIADDFIVPIHIEQLKVDEVSDKANNAE